MKDFDKLLEKYAELVVKVGVNIQPGQVLIVQSPLETVQFTRLIVSKAYEAGAKYVQVEWDDEMISRIRYEKAPDNSFEYYPKWQADMMEQLAEGGGALLHIKVPDPMLLKGLMERKYPPPSKLRPWPVRNFKATSAPIKSAGR